MPNYSKFRDLVSHRIVIEYDTGARIVGHLEACRPETGPVQFVKLSKAELQDKEGNVLNEVPENLWLCPNVLTGFNLQEGPSGRDL